MRALNARFGPGGSDLTDAEAGHLLPVSFAQNSRDELRLQGDGDISGALASQPGMKQQTYLAYNIHPRHGTAHDLRATPTETSTALPAENTSTGYDHGTRLVSPTTVRRLTPVECERLQGFPDDWTVSLSDTARYRTLGNAVTVNVAEWIMRRIATSYPQAI